MQRTNTPMQGCDPTLPSMKKQIEIYKRLHGTRHTCQHPACNRITLQQFCDKHRPITTLINQQEIEQ